MGSPAKSIEGYILFVRNIHEEAQEEDVSDLFREFGQVKNICLELEKKTGLVKGYALVEYIEKDDAQRAISEMDGKEFRDRTLSVNWAFMDRPIENNYTKFVGEQQLQDSPFKSNYDADSSSGSSSFSYRRRGRGGYRSRRGGSGGRGRRSSDRSFHYRK